MVLQSYYMHRLIRLKSVFASSSQRKHPSLPFHSSTMCSALGKTAAQVANMGQAAQDDAYDDYACLVRKKQPTVTHSPAVHLRLFEVG